MSARRDVAAAGPGGADGPYSAACTGLYDGSERIGVLYVGLPLDSMPGSAG